MVDTTPHRPDDGAQVPLPIQTPPRKKTSGGIIALIVICLVVFLGLTLTLIVASVDRMGQSAVNQFSQVQFCFDHPKNPACRPNGTPSP
jgi:hypothetical protein